MRLALAAVTLFALAPQDPEVSAEGERERLTEHVNGLDGFTVRYSMFPWEQDPIELRIVYAAPDRAMLRMTKPEGTMTLWVSRGVIAMRSESADEVSFGEFDASAMFDELRDVREAMYDAFGDGVDLAGGLRPSFHVHPDDRTAEGEPRFTIELQLAEAGASFFCWDGVHSDVFEDVTLDGGHVVLHASGDDKTLKIAREQSAGFLELAFGEGTSGPVTMRLDGLELDCDEDELEIPDAPDDLRGARDLTEGLTATARAMAGPGAVRRNVYQAVQRRLESGELEWDDDTRELAGEVFELFHRHPLPAQFEEWMEQPREFIRTAAERLSEMIERGDVGADELAAGVASWRHDLAGKLHRGEQAYAAKLTAPLEGDWVEELVELERDVSRTLYVETITEPLMTAFDSDVAGLL